MAAFIVDFNPALHQKVRHNDQLYVVFLDDYDFFALPPDAELIIHFVSHDKIVVHDDEAILQLYTVKKRDLLVVEPDAVE